MRQQVAWVFLEHRGNRLPSPMKLALIIAHLGQRNRLARSVPISRLVTANNAPSEVESLGLERKSRYRNAAALGLTSDVRTEVFPGPAAERVIRVPHSYEHVPAGNRITFSDRAVSQAPVASFSLQPAQPDGTTNPSSIRSRKSAAQQLSDDRTAGVHSKSSG